MDTNASSTAAAQRPKWLRVLTPSWVRWDPEVNHELSWALNVLYGFVAAFTVANLYWTHPILNILAADFGVSDERVSLIPTLLQAGYAIGLLFIVPIGDIAYRRPLILSLMFSASMLWLGATLTTDFNTFLGLSFLIGLLTCAPQFMFPLVVQYAAPRHRGTMIAIVMSGLVFGVLVARLLSGIITQYSSWRVVYWMSFGLQVFVLVMLFLLLPDYPILRPGTSYPQILLTILKLPFRHPLLNQQSMIAFLTMAVFTSFWTTLTFQLSGHFNLSTLDIGLFALVGLSPVCLNPVVSIFTRKLHPTGTLLIAHVLSLAAILIATFVGTFSIAGPVIFAFLGDLGMNTITIASRTAIARVDPKAQNAVNSVYMVMSFCGQLTGTAAGNQLYAVGGWVTSGGLSVAFIALSLLLVIARGPHEKGWIGWGGGWNLINQDIGEAPAAAAPPPQAEAKTSVSGLDLETEPQSEGKGTAARVPDPAEPGSEPVEMEQRANDKSDDN